MNDVGAGLLTGLIYLAGSGLVFVLGSSYYTLFPTNRSRSFRVGLVVAFAVASGLTMGGGLDPTYGLLALGFLAAAAANVFGAEAARLHRRLGFSDDSMTGMGLAKGLEALVVVGTILAILAIGRVPLASVYLTVGNVPLGLGIGLGGFVLFAVLAALQGRSMKIPAATVRRLLPAILLFVFANAFMEELWFRGIFLRPLASAVGPIPAIVLTAAVFAVAHIGASYMAKEERIRFLLILFPLGLAWGAAIHFTGSLLASTLFHAGADLMIVNGFLAALRGPKADDGA